jgi:hypothetical protein
MEKHFMRLKIIIILLFSIAQLQGMAQAPDNTLVPYRQGEKWGYADGSRQIVIKPQYDDAAFFYEGFAAVKKSGKYGYINQSGKLVIPYKFLLAKPFQHGYVENRKTHKDDTLLFAAASVKADGYEICIDTRGNRMLKCPAINENTIPGNNRPAENIKEKVYGLVANENLYEKILDDYQTDGSPDTYYLALKNSRYGVINNKFETVVPFDYSHLTIVKENGKVYLLSDNNGNKGVLSGKGAVLIPADYSKLDLIKTNKDKDFLSAEKNGKSGVLELNGETLVPFDYTVINWDENGGFVLIDGQGRKGFYFLNNVLIVPVYNNVKLVRGGNFLYVTTREGKRGYVNNQGEDFFEE